MNKDGKGDNKKMVEDSDEVRRMSHGMRERGKRDGRGEGWQLDQEREREREGESMEGRESV